MNKETPIPRDPNNSNVGNIYIQALGPDVGIICVLWMLRENGLAAQSAGMPPESTVQWATCAIPILAEDVRLVFNPLP